MRLTVSGVLSDHLGRVLLRQIDSRHLQPIIRELNPGESPDEALAVAFRADTGLIVLPVRLTGIYLTRVGKDAELALAFRCTMRGGDLQSSPGQVGAGFFDSNPLPRALSGLDRERVEEALSHAGGSAVWKMQNAARTLTGGRGHRTAVKNPASSWNVRVRVAIFDEQGRLGLVTSQSKEDRPLPGDTLQDGEAPWDTAQRLLRNVGGHDAVLVGLTGVYTAANSAELAIVFGAYAAETANVTALTFAPLPDVSTALSTEEAVMTADALSVLERARQTRATVIGRLG